MTVGPTQVEFMVYVNVPTPLHPIANEASLHWRECWKNDPSESSNSYRIRFRFLYFFCTLFGLHCFVCIIANISWHLFLFPRSLCSSTSFRKICLPGFVLLLLVPMLCFLRISKRSALLLTPTAFVIAFRSATIIYTGAVFVAISFKGVMA